MPGQCRTPECKAEAIACREHVRELVRTGDELVGLLGRRVRAQQQARRTAEADIGELLDKLQPIVEALERGTCDSMPEEIERVLVELLHDGGHDCGRAVCQTCDPQIVEGQVVGTPEDLNAPAVVDALERARRTTGDELAGWTSRFARHLEGELPPPPPGYQVPGFLRSDCPAAVAGKDPEDVVEIPTSTDEVIAGHACREPGCTMPGCMGLGPMSPEELEALLNTPPPPPAGCHVPLLDDEEELLKNVPPMPQTCRRCGCTNERACPPERGGPCSWVELDLCSSCAPADVDPAGLDGPLARAALNTARACAEYQVDLRAVDRASATLGRLREKWAALHRPRGTWRTMVDWARDWVYLLGAAGVVAFWALMAWVAWSLAN